MKILAWVHLYAPDHCAGAEMMLHEILLGMVARGHEVHVICDRSSTSEYEGVGISTRDKLNEKERENLIDWSDVVITHLDRTREVIRLLAHRKPLVHLVHNDRQLAYHRVRLPDAQLVVANSEWIKRAIKWRGTTIVVHPPVHAERYRTARPGAEAMTLINLSEEKGAKTFWALAEQMPEREFIGVIGGYGVQVVRDPIPPNVTIVAHTPTITDVYRQTRILLCPSGYESWGRVGVEAMASGIPTIAHPTPGLLESLRGSGTFVDREDIDGWRTEIQILDDDDIYAARSRQAVLRSAELDPSDDIDRLEAALLRLTTPKERHANVRPARR